MALEEGFSEGDTSSSTASNNQVPLAVPRRAFECPICLDTIEEETTVSWCRHAFCFPCILEWACIRPICPICQEPFQYLFRKVGENNYEVYYTSSSRRNRRRRHHHHSAERRRHRSRGHWHHRSSSRDRGRSRARDWERDQSRSQRQNQGGHNRGQPAQNYNPSSSRRWQHSRAQDTASETSHGWDRAARHERDVPVHLGRSEHRQQAQWDSSRESQATSRRSWRRSHSAWQPTEREEQRRRDRNEGQPARHEQDVPDSLERSEHHQQAQRDSSREPQATRSQSRRSRQTSHSPEGHRESAQMALQKGLAEGGSSSSTASNNQVLQAESPCNSENQMCPICLENINNQVSVSWCSHAFCFPCILEWSRNKAVCPICREPFQYLLRKVGHNNYEVYSIGHYTSSARRNRRRRHHHHSAERRRHRSRGHRHHRFSSRERGRSQARDWERDQSRSQRQNQGGHNRGQPAQNYNPSSSRRWQHSRAQDTASETSHGWDRAARHERDVPVHLGRSEHRQQAQRDSSREPQATRSRSRRSRQTSPSPEGHRER